MKIRRGAQRQSPGAAVLFTLKFTALFGLLQGADSEATVLSTPPSGLSATATAGSGGGGGGGHANPDGGWRPVPQLTPPKVLHVARVADIGMPPGTDANICRAQPPPVVCDRYMRLLVALMSFAGTQLRLSSTQGLFLIDEDPLDKPWPHMFNKQCYAHRIPTATMPTTLAVAQSECRDDPNCGGVYKPLGLSWNDEGKGAYFLCDERPADDSVEGGQVWGKPLTATDKLDSVAWLGRLLAVRPQLVVRRHDNATVWSVINAMNDDAAAMWSMPKRLLTYVKYSYATSPQSLNAARMAASRLNATMIDASLVDEAEGLGFRPAQSADVDGVLWTADVSNMTDARIVAEWLPHMRPATLGLEQFTSRPGFYAYQSDVAAAWPLVSWSPDGANQTALSLARRSFLRTMVNDSLVRSKGTPQL